MQEIARRRDRIYLVARHDGEVIGYGGLMLTGREAHITTIAVDPEFQRRGLGMKIMGGLMDAAIREKADSVSLEVRKTNTGAQKMYERFGFRPVGIRKGYYIETGEDAVVMWVEGVDTSAYAVQLARLSRENERRHRG
jgi:ribosomal-protein-alanine N-acetyltransferase